MDRQANNFIQLLRASINAGVQPDLDEPNYAEILMLAQKHAVTSLLYPAAKRAALPPEIVAELKKLSFAAATRESLQARELTQILNACEEKEISVVPLKGCIIKYLYPNPELRYMSDIDLLIPAKKATAMRELMEQLGHRYEKVDAGTTDVYISPLGMNYEIHLDLSSEGFHAASEAFLASLLALAQPRTGHRYVCELPVEEHYIYVLCHFVKHLIYGGIGVRQLMDIYICRKKWALDEKKLRAFLKKLDLAVFNETVLSLGRHWFEGGKADETASQLGEYILGSGVFGNEEQRVTDRILKEGQGTRYIFKRIFPPYRIMKEYFPVLKKLPFLLPFLWVWRAIRAVLFRRNKLSTEVAVMGATDSQSLSDRAAFYQRCGLQVYTERNES